MTATTTEQGAVSVRNVCKSFARRSRKAPERLVLDGFDLDVHRNSCSTCASAIG